MKENSMAKNLPQNTETEAMANCQHHPNCC